MRSKRYENNKNHTPNKRPERQHCTYRKRQTKAFAQPKADSEGNERFRRTVSQRFLQDSVAGSVRVSMVSPCPIGHPPFQESRVDVGIDPYGIFLFKGTRANDVRPYGEISGMVK